MSTIASQHEDFVMPQAPAGEAVPWTPEEALGGVAARFERVVRARPEAVAVKNGQRRVSYGELNASANRIAHALVRRLAEGEVPVASLLSDRLHVIQALVGVFKAGKIHAPLVPDQPAARLQQILADVDAPLVIIDGAQRTLAAQLGLPAERLLDLDALDPDLPAHDLGLSHSSQSVAYIIYTSGSTGRPKGVAQRYGHMMAGLYRAAAYGQLHFGVNVLLMSSPGYIAAVTNIISPLLNGATICPFALEVEGLANLREFLLRERIPGLAVAASTFRHFMATLRAEDCFPDISLVWLFGEPVLRKDFELFKQHFPLDAQLGTGLGSTEAGSLSWLMLNQHSTVSESVLPAGHLIDIEQEVYIVDEEGSRVGPEVVGEIVVKSHEFGTDYWRNPELNARAFAPDPAGGGARVFRTGDLGLLRADGMLVHHGRKDFQVKIRGNRIELGEIEMALFDLGNIRENVVVARPDSAGEMQLIAYVVPEGRPAPAADGAAPAHRTAVGESRGLISAGGAAPARHTAVGEAGGLVSAGGLRRRLKDQLPAYMVPAAFVILDALPLTTSGKIDRAQLPAAEWSRSASAGARDSLESQLAEMWEGLLHVPAVGTNENFFDLGGNSLLAMQLFSDIQQTLGRKLPLSILFQAGTIAELAAMIRADEPCERSEECLVPIHARGRLRPLYLVAGGEGGDAELLMFARMGRYLGSEQPFYGLRARAVRRGREANGEVEEIAAGHLAEIRAIQPEGPYLLGGVCIGGIVAVEMARQLRLQHEPVSLLCLFDTVRPTYRAMLREQPARLTNLWREGRRRVARALQNPAHIPAAMARPRAAAPDYRYAKATLRYHPRRFAERMTLLVNEEYHRKDPHLGWKPLAGGGIEVHVMPGTHDTYLTEHVQRTSECLRECLERAQGLRSADEPLAD